MNNHIYALNTDSISDEQIFDIYYNSMPQNRKQKIERMKFYKDKLLSLGAGMLMQKVLDRFELSYTDISYNEYGKPLINNRNDAFFNISHTGNIVVCAVSAFKVGVDIEKIQYFENKLLKYLFLDNEILYIRNHSSDQNYDFTKLWTAKESLVKYFGSGLLLDPLNLYFNNGVLDEVYNDGKKISNVYFKTFDMNGYVMTVCSEYEHFSQNIEWFIPDKSSSLILNDSPLNIYNP